MAPSKRQSRSSAVWEIARRQRWLVRHDQLVALGYGPEAIRHRVAKGRLYVIRPGVYAVGRRDLDPPGEWLAAVFACGPAAVLSHSSAAALWGIRAKCGRPFEVTIPANANRRPPGIRVHRRDLPPSDRATRHRIPLTSPIRTMLDLATRLPTAQLERSIVEADRLDLIDPETLALALEDRAGQRGVKRLRSVLHRHTFTFTFTFTDTELERAFLPIAARAGLPPPLTQQWVNGCRVDFFWAELGLVVETDGLRYHRTPADQARDAKRDHAHAAAGLTHARFSHAEINYEPRYVEAVLRRVAERRS